VQLHICYPHIYISSHNLKLDISCWKGTRLLVYSPVIIRSFGLIQKRGF